MANEIKDLMELANGDSDTTVMDKLQAVIGNWRFQELKEHFKTLQTDYAEFLIQQDYNKLKTTPEDPDPPIWFSSFIYTITHLQMLYKQAERSNNLIMLGLTEEAAKLLRQIIKECDEPTKQD